jgi:hypothetical protein
MIRVRDQRTLGGHRGTKIYGRLNCASVHRAIGRGGYIKHRVFFADVQTAVAARTQIILGWHDGALDLTTAQTIDELVDIFQSLAP